MKVIRLVLKDGGETWAPVSFLEKLDIFRKRPELLKVDDYAVRSDVSLQVLNLFLSRVFGKESQLSVTHENAEALKSLCDELGFGGFDAELREILGESPTKVQQELLRLRARLDRQELALEQLQRHVRDLECQQKNEFERRLDELSRQFDLRFERVECGLHEAGVRGDEVNSLKREMGIVRDEMGKLKREGTAEVGQCQTSLASVRDEVMALKASLKSEASSSCENLSVLYRTLDTSCVFAWLHIEEEKLGRKMLVVRKSSNDLYGMLDPDSTDIYTSFKTRGAWIEIEFKAAVRINGLKVTSGRVAHPKTFDVTFSDGSPACAKYQLSFVDETGLNGKNLSVERNFDAVWAKLIRIESRGPNWSGSDWLTIGGFELFSPDDVCAEGVFRSIFARSRDCVWDVFDVRARDAHGCQLYFPNDEEGVCTSAGDQEWVEVGLLHGRLMLSRYRIKKSKKGLRGWSLRASNDRNTPLDTWSVIHRHREVTEAEQTSEVLEFECLSVTPFRFFRIVQEEKRWDGKRFLRFHYFDVGGTFIPD